MYAYNAIHGTVSVCLEEVVVVFQPTRSFRSESESLLSASLTIRKCKTLVNYKKEKTNLFISADLT